MLPISVKEATAVKSVADVSATPEGSSAQVKKEPSEVTDDSGRCIASAAAGEGVAAAAEAETVVERKDESAVTLEEAASATSPAAAQQQSKTSIRINITSQVEKVELAQGEATEGTVQTEFDMDAVVQGVQGDLTEEQLEAKPKLKGRKLMVLPPQSKDSDMSSLCVIM
jgi:hypothetical protein